MDQWTVGLDSLLILYQIAAAAQPPHEEYSMSINGLISVFTAKLEIIARRYIRGD